jgi:DNA-binding transcriptional MocR family regulator
MLEKGFPNLDAFDRMLRCETVKACVLMTSCRNPVGTTMPDSGKEALVAMLHRRGVPLIEEDSNAELCFSSRAPRPAKAFDQVGYVLHMGTFANSLEPGGGVGWIAAGRYRARLLELQASSSGPTSALNQAAVAEYLKGGRYDAHLRRLRRALSQRCRQLLEALHEVLPAESRVQPPDGGCVTWVQLPRIIDGRELRRRARREGVGLAPGAMFSTHPAFKNFVCVGFGDAWSEQREGAVRTLGRLVAERNETGAET